MGEIENESPVPATEEHIEIVRNVQVNAKSVYPGGSIEPGRRAEIFDVMEDKFDSDEDIGDIENEEVAEEIAEEVIKPVYEKKEETFTAKVDMMTESKDTWTESKDTWMESKDKQTESKDTWMASKDIRTEPKVTWTESKDKR